jgi:hypothetical protein
VAVRLEHDVGCDAQAGRDPGAQTILGNVSDAGRDHAARIPASHTTPADLDRSPRRRPHADDRLGKLALTVPRHACNRDDLAAADAERDVLDGRHAAVAVCPDAVELQNGVAHGRAIVVTPSDLDLATDHQRGQRPWRRLRRGDRCE